MPKRTRAATSGEGLPPLSYFAREALAAVDQFQEALARLNLLPSDWQRRAIIQLAEDDHTPVDVIRALDTWLNTKEETR